MPELSKDLVALLQYLASGFLVAWVYFGLTSQIKPSQFERVVQALIFTVTIQALVALEKWVAERIGTTISFGEWTATSELVASLLTALFLGAAMSILVNADGVHVLARKWKISTRSGHPSEWFGAFCDHRCYIVLHLKDGTRLYGWPSKWPSDASAGHFFLTDVVRIAHGIEQPLPMLNGILIDVKDVSSVEFVRQSQETTDDQANQPTEPAKPTSSREEGTSKREPSGELHAAADPAISAN